MKTKRFTSNGSEDSAGRATGRAARFVWNGGDVVIHHVGTGPKIDLSLAARPARPDAWWMKVPEGGRRREDYSGRRSAPLDHWRDYSPTQLYVTRHLMREDHPADAAFDDYMEMHPDADAVVVLAEIVRAVGDD